MIVLETCSANETEELGEKLSALLMKESVVAFIGDLATGKTTMIRGICRGLEIQQQVESPTYTLVNEYDGAIPIYHIDCYREHRIEEWIVLGINDYFYGDGITLVEWADTIEELIPDTAIRIRMNHRIDRNNCRGIHIQAPPEIERQLEQRIKIS
ncbi:MAG: tRNA (adenosine(37)-N6)-threonylcarbamoyltransferase complex ATPase subunit type 1 TsaE [Candidatus Marinimicrobia bacterium]|nr:tRNA (adenosine(37)-N6)-threonylcarbamoyltransferase complex ATPase subunit type 1 TsaE [Candidatus Neomarinimicrobiota bacterium]MBL7066816.1 tRNA (adenosine(37)-N6)-threonylcarbamoyltransferase complex ATPase subunit type 1 TsaE [Candidatus Neomarinimicrobiota bacterium]